MAMLPAERLAVCLDDLGSDVKTALRTAAELRFRAVDIGAVAGPISPKELSTTGRRHFLRHLSDLGLRPVSLRGPAGRGGYLDGSSGERRLDLMRQIIRLAADLGVPVVSTTLGRVDGGDESRASTGEVLSILADDADRAGITVAIESSGVRAAALQSLLSSIRCPNLAVCADSGAMIMQGDDPHALADTLMGRLCLARVRDAVAGRPDAPGHEVAMGQGELDPASLLAALTNAGYEGQIVLTRSEGANRLADILQAREVFEALSQ
jgi:sugar phosphate isomerase/epimerase